MRPTTTPPVSYSTTPPAKPLQVSTVPRENDLRLFVHVAPGAPLGVCEVVLGLGRGSKGKGQRPGDDHALHVAAVRCLAEDLRAYAHDYEQAALAEDPAGWWERLAVAADSVRPGRTTLCPSRRNASPWSSPTSTRLLRCSVCSAFTWRGSTTTLTTRGGRQPERPIRLPSPPARFITMRTPSPRS